MVYFGHTHAVTGTTLSYCVSQVPVIKMLDVGGDISNLTSRDASLDAIADGSYFGQ